MRSWRVVMGETALQSFWLTFVWFHNGGWKVHYAFFLFQTHLPIWWFACAFLHHLFCFCFLFKLKKHDLQVDPLQTLPTPETNSHFLCMLGHRGDNNTSHPSCFNPLNDRSASVSARVKLCSCTFIDGWQTRVSPRTWLPHQPDLNFTNMSLCGVARNPLILNTPTGAHVWQRLLFPVVTETPRTDGGINLASAAL